MALYMNNERPIETAASVIAKGASSQNNCHEVLEGIEPLPSFR